MAARIAGKIASPSMIGRSARNHAAPGPGSRKAPRTVRIDIPVMNAFALPVPCSRSTP